MCLNHPELVHKHPTHIAISVLVRRFDEVGSICLNHPELGHKHPHPTLSHPSLPQHSPT